MRRDQAPDAWPWPDPPETGERRGELEDAFVRCFASEHGRLVLAHLRRLFLDRRVGPEASDAALRHLEGQRSVAAHILSLATRRGRRPSPTFPNLHGGNSDD